MNGAASRRTWRPAGFTLVEILVVLVIVSALSGIVVANFPAFTRTADFDEEVRRLSALLDLLTLEAQSQANEYGFRPTETGYRFYVYDEMERGWQELEERPFQPRELDEGMSITLKVESSELALITDDDTVPPVLVLSSGEMTPFELRLTGNEGSKVLIADGFGELEWVQDADR